MHVSRQKQILDLVARLLLDPLIDADSFTLGIRSEVRFLKARAEAFLLNGEELGLPGESVLGPSTTIGANSPSRRKAATKVVVFQWPWGTKSSTRWLVGPHPSRRVIVVLPNVSSKKTRRRGSIPAAKTFQTARSATTSGRFCSAAWIVFF